MSDKLQNINRGPSATLVAAGYGGSHALLMVVFYRLRHRGSAR
jgi:hypothetical protein